VAKRVVVAVCHEDALHCGVVAVLFRRAGLLLLLLTAPADEADRRAPKQQHIFGCGLQACQKALERQQAQTLPSSKRKAGTKSLRSRTSLGPPATARDLIALFSRPFGSLFD
jgi:hypothetical protein